MTRDRTRGPQTLRRRTLKAMRGVLGERGAVEKKARSAVNAAKFVMGRPIMRPDMYAMRGASRDRVGIFGMGGCDVRSIVGAGPLLSRRTDRTVGLAVYGHGPEVRSDVLLQTLEPPDVESTAEVAERLGLTAGYFQPRLFEPRFTIKKQIGVGSFPKDVVVMSISSDVSRVVYRHKESNLLVDPGGWWLENDLGAVMQDTTTTRWFGENFRSTRRISVEQSMANFERIITEVRHRTGAFVVMLNVLTVDPGRGALDYQHANSPNRMRRREFGLALAELAGRLDFPVLDIDRITKGAGISHQADFVHYTPRQKKAICRELDELLLQSGVAAERRRPPSVAATTTA